MYAHLNASNNYTDIYLSSTYESIVTDNIFRYSANLNNRSMIWLTDGAAANIINDNIFNNDYNNNNCTGIKIDQSVTDTRIINNHFFSAAGNQDNEIYDNGLRTTILSNEEAGIGIQVNSPREDLDIAGGQIIRDNEKLEDVNSGMKFTSAAGNNYIQSIGEGLAHGSSSDLLFTDMNAVNAWMVIRENTGNVGIGARWPYAKLTVNGAIKTEPTDNPQACNSHLKGGIYFDNSLNEPCYCDGASWKQFDGDGACS